MVHKTRKKKRCCTHVDGGRPDPLVGGPFLTCWQKRKQATALKSFSWELIVFSFDFCTKQKQKKHTSQHRRKDTTKTPNLSLTKTQAKENHVHKKPRNFFFLSKAKINQCNRTRNPTILTTQQIPQKPIKTSKQQHNITKPTQKKQHYNKDITKNLWGPHR